MKLGLINSAFAQAGVDTATGLKHIARIGFDCVDIFTEAMTISKKEKLLIARTCDRARLPIISLPVVATGLIDFNDPVRAFHVARCKRFVDLAAEFGAKNILLGLLREGDGVAAPVLVSLGVNFDETRRLILKELDPNFGK